MRTLYKRSSLTALFCVLVMFLCSCSIMRQRDFDKNRELWKSKQITDYRYNFRWFAYGPADAAGKTVTFEVRGGKNVSVKCQNCETENSEFFQGFDTIDKVFEKIEKGINLNPHVFDADYNETLGYPVNVDAEEDIMATDNSWGLKISNFEEIK